MQTQSDSTHTAAQGAASLSPMQMALQNRKGYYTFLVLMLVLLSALGSFVNDMYAPHCRPCAGSSTAQCLWCRWA